MARLALITGSSSGIGLATAKRLASLPDYTVVITGLCEEDLDQARTEMAQADLQALYHVLDVTDATSIERLHRWLRATAGEVDILINNAAIMPPWEPVPEEPDFFSVDPATTAQVFEVNTLGALRMCQVFVPAMLEKGYGRVVNVASEAGCLSRMLTDPWPYAPSYRISKTAVNAVTVLLAKQVVGSNVLVNSVCPGWVRTRLGGENAVSSPEEASEQIAYLATLVDDGPHGGFFGELRPHGQPNKLEW